MLCTAVIFLLNLRTIFCILFSFRIDFICFSGCESVLCRAVLLLLRFRVLVSFRQNLLVPLCQECVLLIAVLLLLRLGFDFPQVRDYSKNLVNAVLNFLFP